MTPPPEKKSNAVGLQSVVERMEEEVYLISEASRRTKVPVSTLRYWYRNGKTQAPSKVLSSGNATVYLYTPEDLEEVIAYRTERMRNV